MTHVKPAQAGGSTPGASHTTTRRPNAAASAAEPHEPEPWPRNERPGRTAGGHAPDGRTTNRPGTPGATERTQAADRRANAPTAPARANRGDLAEKTNSDLEPVKNSRTAASTPTAHPTDTRHAALGTEGRRADNAATASGDGEREPEKPTEDTPDNKAAGEETGDETSINKKLNITYYSTYTRYKASMVRDAAAHGKPATLLIFLGFQPKIE